MYSNLPRGLDESVGIDLGSSPGQVTQFLLFLMVDLRRIVSFVDESFADWSLRTKQKLAFLRCRFERTTDEWIRLSSIRFTL